jgi:hypothetical protein
MRLKTWIHINAICCTLLLRLSGCTINSLLLFSWTFTSSLGTTHRVYTITVLFGWCSDVWNSHFSFLCRFLSEIPWRFIFIIILKCLFITLIEAFSVKAAYYHFLVELAKRSTYTAHIISQKCFHQKRLVILNYFTLSCGFRTAWVLRLLRGALYGTSRRFLLFWWMLYFWLVNVVLILL